jgi:hypothetical protein
LQQCALFVAVFGYDATIKCAEQMSTDYYLLKNVCPHCGKPEKEMQIGTSSSGWCFGLRVIPLYG